MPSRTSHNMDIDQSDPESISEDHYKTTNFDYDSGAWASEIFFPGGGALGDFSKIFPGGPKVVKFVFFPLKTKKQPFSLKISKSRKGPCSPSDAHVQETGGYFGSH